MNMKDKFPNIWVPRVGIIEGEMGFNGGKIAGQYTLRKYKADTDELVQEIGPFDNLITDQGLNRVGTANFAQYIFVGTGTATPAVTDTKLGNYLAYTSGYAPGGNWNAALLYGGSPDYWVQGSGTWRFNAGVAAGTLTEVGVGWGTGVGHLVSSRALIVDGGGSPVSITVLADEYLDVTYSLKHYPYIGSDVVQTVVISGVNYTFTSRSVGVNTNSYHIINAVEYMKWLGQGVFYTGTAAGTPPSLAAITATGMINIGGAGYFTQTDDGAYVSGSYERKGKFTASLTQGNLTYGIRAMLVQPWFLGGDGFIKSTFQTTISPAIPKDSTKVLQFGASVSWSRR